MSNSFLDHLLRDLNTLLVDVDGLTADLSKEEFEQLPGPKKWSILSVIGHLNKTGQEYLPLLETACLNAPISNLAKHVPYRPTRTGRLFVSYVSPESKRKLPAPAKFKPVVSKNSAEAVEELKRQFSALVDLLGKLDGRDFNEVKFSSPVSRLVRFTLGDGLMVVIQHARRHVLQIERIKGAIRAPGFSVS